MFILYVSVIVFAVWLITHWIKSATSAKIREELEREYQEKHKRLESEYATKVSALEKREQNVALQDERWKTVDKITEWASRRLRYADERERDLACQELDLEQRAQLLHRDIEAVIDYRVESQLAEYIRNKEKELKERERIVNRQSRNYVYRLSKCDEREKEMYQRAVLIADHLGVPLKCILKPQEKKLVDQLANELAEEHYALIDLVMSYPDDRAKDLLTWMQRFPRS